MRSLLLCCYWSEEFWLSVLFLQRRLWNLSAPFPSWRNVKTDYGPDGFNYLDNRGVATAAFLRALLKPLREARIWEPTAAPAGVTNLHIHRVMVIAGTGGVNVEFTAEQ